MPCSGHLSTLPDGTRCTLSRCCKIGNQLDTPEVWSALESVLEWAPGMSALESALESAPGLLALESALESAPHNCQWDQGFDWAGKLCTHWRCTHYIQHQTRSCNVERWPLRGFLCNYNKMGYRLSKWLKFWIWYMLL